MTLYLLLFHGNDGCTNAPQSHVICTLPVLFGHNIKLRIVVKFVPVDLKTTSSNSVSRFTIYFYLRTKFNMFTSNLPLLMSTETKATEDICRAVTIFYSLHRYCIFRVKLSSLHFLKPKMKTVRFF